MTIDIEKLADDFFEFPDENNKRFVTYTSAKLFAAKVLEDKEREVAEMKEQLEDETKWASHYATQFHNAQAHINDLREELETALTSLRRLND